MTRTLTVLSRAGGRGGRNPSYRERSRKWSQKCRGEGLCPTCVVAPSALHGTLVDAAALPDGLSCRCGFPDVFVGYYIRKKMPPLCCVRESQVVSTE